MISSIKTAILLEDNHPDHPIHGIPAGPRETKKREGGRMTRF